ncbi:PilN family type IVB pilus formation outer membrane protein [Paraburkholderia flava]|uniref:PilN family type IVB pilus formation outer membrane protein n=1 Tax=Paraburkholderia flava TaxID=2547393 RepID=UPI00105DC5F9|nr:PilN family type IVB pilus formation outer membrane protein [Paraburkholderia flava]
MRALKHVAAFGVSLCLLTGCTGLLQGIHHDSQADLSRSQNLLDASHHGDNREHDTDAVIVSDQLWLSGNTLKIAKTTTLPGVFNEPASFDGTVDSLRAFADRITRLTHMLVKVAPGADDAAANATQGGGLMTSASPSAAPYPGLPPLPTGLLQSPLPGGSRGGSSSGEGRAVHIVYAHGDLRGLLDAAAARFGVYWKYQDGAIVLYYTDTRVYQVSALPGDSKLETLVNSGATNSGGTSGGSGGGGGGGGGAGGGGGGSGSGPAVSSDNTANTSMNATLSVYTSLQAGIKAMLSPVGSVVPSPATGSITVTDTPDVLERVGSFMDQENRVLSRQILINVTVLSVTLSADDSYGINWTAVYQALGTRFTFGNSVFSGLTGTPTGPNGTVSATVLSPNSRANATSAVISALSDQGTVRRKTSASVTTLNDQPVPVQVATQTGYLAQISTTATLNVGTQTSLTAGTVTTGFNLTLLPHILDDGTVMMQFYTNISSLTDLKSFPPNPTATNGEQIQLPTVDTRNFLQRISMKSGQTLMIGGYEGVVDNGNQSGIGSPANYALGGGFTAQRSREVIVILISPVTMNGA